MNETDTLVLLLLGYLIAVALGIAFAIIALSMGWDEKITHWINRNKW